MDIHDIKGFIFDIDGVIFRGNALIDGAQETLKLLKEKNKKYIFVSNHTIYSNNDYIAKLRKFGLEVDDNQLLTANNAAISYMQNQESRTHLKIHIIGERGIFTEFEKAGFTLTDENPDYVVSSWDSNLTYEKLYKAVTNVRNGAKFIVTSPDRYLPTERGLDLGYGTIGAAISYATRVDPIYTGKPYSPIIHAAAEKLGLEESDIAIVGDTLETDIASKHMAGLGLAILVLSGNTKKEDMEQNSEDKPDIVLDSIKNLPEFL